MSNVTDTGRQNIYLDIPEINTEAYLLVNELGMQPVFETTRMYTRSFPNMAQNKIFGITSFEVG